MRERKHFGLRFLLVAASIVFGGLFGAGCETADPHETNIPWARPATWEGGAPGMGGGGLNQGRTGY